MQSVISPLPLLKGQAFSHAVRSLPSSCMYPCQRCSSSAGSEEQLYRENMYLTPGRKLADGKERDYYVLYSVISNVTSIYWHILEIKLCLSMREGEVEGPVSIAKNSRVQRYWSF